jgi:hypothetical protein
MHQSTEEEEFDDNKEVLRIRKPKKNRQHNGEKKKDKGTNNDQQNIHIKLKDRGTPNQQKTGRVSSSWSTSGTCRVNLVTNLVINHEWGKDREELTTSGTYP